MALCPPCEEKLDHDLKGKFVLSETLCDCDVLRRWICVKCALQEGNEAFDYLKKHTAAESSPCANRELYDRVVEDVTREVLDHQHMRCFFCPCGADVPSDTPLRCTWCKRRHLPDRLWREEWNSLNSAPDMKVKKDPTYPYWRVDPTTEKYPVPYPELPYSRIVKKLQET
ncbi:hypothetical protein QBC46DRAFT_405993 [Diplogelasinospora grovesii]|uniref:Uncharacterized protein n=1 Tax=Diplogelasinospora grovesii TaxID=303347 RepID=A0AAN6NFD6_9PEZI|nr:hypothetical protein QBC46DRAFT_405993 [Diplogelasinospora grovesii]